MSDESAHAITIRLLERLSATIAVSRREELELHKGRVERLLDVRDDESARETAVGLLQDALSH